MQQQQKELDIDPYALNSQADRLDAEVADLRSKAESLESQKMDVERERNEKNAISSSSSEDARRAQERRTQMASHLSTLESEARSHLSILQPLIQDQHSGWQKLVAQQRKLESDGHLLTSRIEESRRSAELEAATRMELSTRIGDMIRNLQSFESFLGRVGDDTGGPGGDVVPTLVSASALPAEFGDDFDDLLREDAPVVVKRANIFDEL